MKKIITAIAALTVAAASLSAQNISVDAGYLNSQFNNSEKASNGFFAGVGADCYFTKNIGVATGLYYSFLTQEASSGASIAGISISGNAVTNEHYFTVPVQLAAKYDLRKDLGLFLNVGPSVNLGLASSSKYSGSISGLGNTEKTIDNYADDSGYKRFDVLMGGKAGIKFSQFRVFAGYNYGLVNRSGVSDVDLHRSEFFVGASILF